MSGRMFVVGDIHGCAPELEALLHALPLEAGDTLAFVGDYIDRGHHSKDVVEMMIAVRARTDIGTVFLRGNHEEMCLGYLGRPGRWGEAWRMNGGSATLESYGMLPNVPVAEAVERIPAAHLQFMENLLPSYVAGRHLLVHAGIRPGRSLADQDEEDLLWIREEFISRPHDLPQTVIFGHTPQRNVLVDLPYKIGIDTGCVYGGWLTALEPNEGLLYQVAYGDRDVRESPLPSRPRRRYA
jgi:calcineurin-like phosphoesterase family protein